MAKWIRDAAAAFDASQALQPSLGAVAVAAPAGNSGDDSGEHSASTVTNLELFMERAQLPRAAREAIARDILATGAIEVDELTREDWEQLPTWHHLKPLEKRRVLRYVPPI